MAKPIVLFFHCEQCCEEECQYSGDKSIGYTSDKQLAIGVKSMTA